MIISYIIPPNYDFLAASIVEGLKECGHMVYTSEDSNYGYFLKRKKFINIANKSDLLLIHSGTYCDYSILRSITHCKVVYIDGSDFPWLDKILDYPINLVFKRELLRNDNQNIFPLPFSVEKRYLKNYTTKKTKITFISTVNNYYRRSIQQYLLNMKLNDEILFIGNTAERSYTGISGLPSPTPKYYKLLGESIASINFPGKGWDCARYWEIIASKACLISPMIEIKIPNPFKENIHYLKFSNLEELKYQIKFCIENPAKAEEIANNAYMHMLEYHTSKVRAEYLLKVIDDKYSVNTFFDIPLKETIRSQKYYFVKQKAYFIWKKVIQKYLKLIINSFINE